jgi:sporulation protein YlmC with PRC-barrel domain
MIGLPVVDQKGNRLGKINDVVIQEGNKLLYVAKKGLVGEDFAIDPDDILGAKDVMIVEKADKIDTTFWDRVICSLKDNRGKHMLDIKGRDWGELVHIVYGPDGEPLFVTSGGTVVPASFLRSIGDHIIVENVPDQEPYKDYAAEPEVLIKTLRSRSKEAPEKRTKERRAKE